MAGDPGSDERVLRRLHLHGKRPRNPKDLQASRVAISHSVVADNQVSFTNIGIVVSDQARKTLLLDNTFQEVEWPILDYGMWTIFRRNRIVTVDKEGQRSENIPDQVTEREQRRPAGASRE